jgi:uncharacterized protein (TIGR02001 family)
MNGTIARSAGFGAASLLAGLLFAGPALADGLPDRGKTRAKDGHDHPCTVSGNVALTTDYVFRGVSQTNSDPSVQTNLDLTCGRFYASVFASNVDFGYDANMELTFSAGYKTTIGRIAWDFGVIYYTYPGQSSPGFDINFFEAKVAGSAEIWKGGTLTGTVFYSPEYTYNWGAVATYEATFSQALPNFAIFSPSFSAVVGHSDFLDYDYASYTYWNVGVTLGFREKWSLDLRYSDSDNEYFADTSLSDERFVATLKYRF